MTEKLVGNCSRLLALLQKVAGKETKYRTELDTDEKDIAFKMIRNNATEVGLCVCAFLTYWPRVECWSLLSLLCWPSAGPLWHCSSLQQDGKMETCANVRF